MSALDVVRNVLFLRLTGYEMRWKKKGDT
jgi:hypothetical protein